MFLLVIFVFLASCCSKAILAGLNVWRFVVFFFNLSEFGIFCALSVAMTDFLKDVFLLLDVVLAELFDCAIFGDFCWLAYFD